MTDSGFVTGLGEDVATKKRKGSRKSRCGMMYVQWSQDAIAVAAVASLAVKRGEASRLSIAMVPQYCRLRDMGPGAVGMT